MTLGLESGTVRLVPHDPAWERLFAEEAARIRAALGPDLALDLEHVGSTAVRDLPAKPILDLLAGHAPGASVEPYIAALVRAGYTHRGESGIPGREFFRLGDPRTHHLHLVTCPSALWNEHLAFRDALRANAEVRAGHAGLKADLMLRFRRDRESYTEGKSAFIRGGH